MKNKKVENNIGKIIIQALFINSSNFILFNVERIKHMKNKKLIKDIGYKEKIIITK